MNTERSSEDLPDVDLPFDEADDSASSGEAADQVNPMDASQLARVQAERDEFRDKWTRTLAELDNTRKRASRELEEYRKYQAAPIVARILPGLDNLDRAIEAAKSTGKAEDLITGVEMVRKQFDDMLASLDVQQISAVGEPFDPNNHEAIQQLPSNEPAMQVLQELERGYRLHDRVIRPSKVIVSSGPAVE